MRKHLKVSLCDSLSQSQYLASQFFLNISKLTQIHLTVPIVYHTHQYISKYIKYSANISHSHKYILLPQIYINILIILLSLKYISWSLSNISYPFKYFTISSVSQVYINISNIPYVFFKHISLSLTCLPPTLKYSTTSQIYLNLQNIVFYQISSCHGLKLARNTWCYLSGVT